MQFKKALVGSFPKNPKLGKAISWYNMNKIDEEKLNKYLKEAMMNLFKLANEIELNYVTNGLFRWDDLVDTSFGFVKGAEKGALQRFLDNNFYYRQPVIKGKIEFAGDDNKFIKDLRFSKEVKEEVGLKSKLKAVILGPVSYYLLSVDEYYKNPVDAITDYSLVVNSLLKNISDVVEVVEIHEPMLLKKGVGNEILEKVPEVYRSMLSGVGLEKHLITYFEIENPKRLDTIFSLPVDYYGIDVVDNLKKLGKVYPYFSGKKVYLGVLDSRNTKMERLITIRRFLHSAEENKASDVIIGNTSLLDFIPEVVAIRKLKLLKNLDKVLTKMVRAK
ncbi:5-methyltetrahydropteroyltriglutamate--homocysteine methyltransferase [Sulfolobus sp. A20]|uniref:5-methyltetrahydropteroyltriglutamate-- homocysteine methyltransferase n=1 Tax=Sulfolobaceae TaxID=118883 RepID=UPI0008461B44|nr:MULTISPECIES: 5-methyltetrahydropteroyltriglutamate--homocysteine methyltransferase [unclassified Sulfolobus]TRM77588.1 hypothetical protein DJ532_04070 [Sulfolobus sp. A20-N-F8]TRM79032.1 hypothetical protein DJ528_03080 [Sulfolobus sp. B5]TRM81009.1 hypothetical protein DJ531_11490 [Sulfolobus sp. A20-N-F6]TRM89885.1 hypothetical protein DJ529_00445 [Sulfolobus sp. C3]TRM99496.1 hypothetical protein DJ530_08785 [Sulfolobus sp. E1]TRN04279.1 hypothetical protein DJ527_00430 [Sulfolobus sp